MSDGGPRGSVPAKAAGGSEAAQERCSSVPCHRSRSPRAVSLKPPTKKKNTTTIRVRSMIPLPSLPWGPPAAEQEAEVATEYGQRSGDRAARPASASSLNRQEPAGRAAQRADSCSRAPPQRFPRAPSAAPPQPGGIRRGISGQLTRRRRGIAACSHASIELSSLRWSSARPRPAPPPTLHPRWPRALP